MDGSFDADEFLIESGRDVQNLPIFRPVILLTDGDLILAKVHKNSVYNLHKDKILHAAKSSFCLLRRLDNTHLVPFGSLAWISPRYAALTGHQTTQLKQINNNRSKENQGPLQLYATPMSFTAESNLNKLATDPTQASTLEVSFSKVNFSSTDLNEQATKDIIGTRASRFGDMAFMEAQLNQFAGPYLIPTSEFNLHCEYASVIGYPQPITKEAVELRYEGIYTPEEIVKVLLKIDYEFNSGGHKTVSPCVIYTHLRNAQPPEIPVVAVHSGSTLPGSSGSPVVHCATGDLIGIHIGTSALKNCNLLLTVHHPIFVHFYTHTVLPDWIEAGIEAEYKARIKKYLEVHLDSEALNHGVLQHFGLKKKRKASKKTSQPKPKKTKTQQTKLIEDEGVPNRTEGTEKEPEETDSELVPICPPERTDDSPFNIDYFAYE